jgi:2-amino-4-hydroxy-6-hydroxymethyldihydropteridine diphosphokinase
MSRACRELAMNGVTIVRRSNLYMTKPVGVGRQPRYLNAVVLAKCSLAPAQLLRLAKRLERSAGRRSRERMSARPLDIDILDQGGRRVGRPAAVRRLGQLILPHPELHRRAFVLHPLIEVDPYWQHPVLHQPAKVLLARTGRAACAGVHQALDLAACPCDKDDS